MGNIVDEIDIKIDKLPSISSVVLEINKELSKDDFSIKKVESLIAKDIGLTAKILRLANTPIYKRGTKSVEKISQAILSIGKNDVKKFILFDNLKDTFSGDLLGYNVESKMFWMHNLLCANMSSLMAKYLKIDTEIAYVSGLLHDIGKIILSDYIKKNNIDVDESITFEDEEKELYGVTHSQVGAKIAKKWGFGFNIIISIEYHHNPEQCENGNIFVNLVHVASIASIASGFGVGIDGTNYNFSSKSLEILNLTQNDIERFLSEALYNTTKIVSELNF